MNFYAGLDSGGTRTRCVVADETGQVVGVGFAGISNYDDVGEVLAGQNIRAAIVAACTNLPENAKLTALFMGLGGVVSDTDRAIIKRISYAETISHLIQPHQIFVDHDCRIALAGAMACQSGIVLIVGTGSSCYGENDGGESWRSGGWGYLIDDGGSSYYLGMRGLAALVQAYDGRAEPNFLTQQLQKNLPFEDLNLLMHWMFAPAVNRAGIAALAPIVAAAAEQGDEFALAIIENGCQKLAQMVAATARKLKMQEPTVAAVGGLASSGELFQKMLYEAILAALPSANLTLPQLPPVLGAILLAMRASGQAINTGMIKNLSSQRNGVG